MDGDIGIDYIDLFIIGIIGINGPWHNPSYNVIWNSSRQNVAYVKGPRGSRNINYGGNSNIENTISRRYNNPRPNSNNNIINNIVNDLRSNGNRVRVYDNPNDIPNNNIIIRNNNGRPSIPNNNSIRGNWRPSNNNNNINSSRPPINFNNSSNSSFSRGSSSSVGRSSVVQVVVQVEVEEVIFKTNP